MHAPFIDSRPADPSSLLAVEPQSTVVNSQWLNLEFQSLPQEVRNCETFAGFKKDHNTYLFRQDMKYQSLIHLRFWFD